MQIDDSALTRYDFLKDLPWLSGMYLGNTIYAYLLTTVTFVVLWALLHVARRFVMRRLAIQERRDQGVRGGTLGLLGELLGHLSPGVFPLLAFYGATKRLTMADAFERGVRFVALIAVTYQIAKIAGELGAYFIRRARGGKADDPAVRSTNQNLIALTRFGIWVAGLLFLLDNLGFNIATFIAGLGIGGVAIALATQAILGDTFSSFAIALDKPFEVGDFIVVDDLMGNVEHIGLKTTRVRSAGGELLIFANSDLTRSRVKNFKKMFQRRAAFRLGVAYDTPQDKLPRVVELLKTAVETQADVRLDRAHFIAFGDAALVFEVAYFVLKPDYNVAMDVQQDINLKVYAALAKEGIHLAFPAKITK